MINDKDQSDSAMSLVGNVTDMSRNLADGIGWPAILFAEFGQSRVCHTLKKQRKIKCKQLIQFH